MGDRANVGFRTSDNDTVFLYMHWGGSDRHEILAKAISYAMERDEDESYFTRILFSQLVDRHNVTTGHGMTVNRLATMGDGYDVPVYSYIDKTISIYQEDWDAMGVFQPRGIASEPDKVYDRDEYLAKYAVRGVGQYV
jgi:hypothetical protein